MSFHTARVKTGKAQTEHICSGLPPIADIDQRRRASTGDCKQTTLWSIPSGGQDVETIHGTQKPVECMWRPMLNNRSPGEAIYDPFLGSGTTLIAAETIGRCAVSSFT
jgi:DNA modification methylase